MKGTLALSWGPSGGFYVHPRRLCLGWVALTLCPGVEIDDLMEAYVDAALGDTAATNTEGETDG